MVNAAPGWYNDPLNSYGTRWWDGQTWTQHTGQSTAPPYTSPAMPPLSTRPVFTSGKPAWWPFGLPLYAAALSLLMLALPWATVDLGFIHQSASGFSTDDGKLMAIVLLVAIGMGAWALFDRRGALGSAITLGIGLLIATYDLLDIASKTTRLTEALNSESDDLSVHAAVGGGLVLLWLLLVAALIISIVQFRKRTAQRSAASYLPGSPPTAYTPGPATAGRY